MHEQTKANLLTALHGEAVAYARYMLFAAHIRQQERGDLADRLDATARTALFEHFAEEAEVAQRVGDDEANLHDAIGGEAYAVDTRYRTFAEQTQAAGAGAAAARFTEVRQDETRHREAFTAALKRLGAGV